MAHQVTITEIYGQCPVQAEGYIAGKPFYFRARGDKWSIYIGIDKDLLGNPEYKYTESYGAWPDAGWITEEEAKEFINRVGNQYIKELKDVKSHRS